MKTEYDEETTKLIAEIEDLISMRYQWLLGEANKSGLTRRLTLKYVHNDNLLRSLQKSLGEVVATAIPVKVTL